MKLIIGLGNPGATHKRNRHNAGHLFVEFEIRNLKFEMNNQKFKFLKTDCLMNDSGGFVKKNLSNLTNSSNLTNLTNLYIVHDDLDLKLGTYKIQFGVGPKVHNGIKNIEEVLGTKDFWRIRIGIDNRSSDGHRETGERYVLEDFTNEELAILRQVQDEIRADLCKN